jgi:(R,R)-butanediol dehydrogenase/meso-butanediol dehydrogenase/diacetyl reductase
VRWHGRGDIRVEDVPAPRPPAPGEVRVRVAWCGLCGTDVHEYRDGPIHVPVEPHPVTNRCAPIILGHEISGWIEAVGAGVSGLAEGDLVGLDAGLPCGECPPCRRGTTQLCVAAGHVGMSADGGLAELVTVPAKMVVAAPAGMDSAVAALSEPFAVAMHAIRRADSPQGTNCVVVGAGAIGLAVAMILRARGNTVTVIDVAEPRLRRAADLGFGTGPNPRAPVVFECAGAPAAPVAAIEAAEPSGLIVLIGLSGTPSTVDFRIVVGRELRVIGSSSHLPDADLAPALDFLADHGDEAASLVTARIPLGDTVTRGFDVLAGPEGAMHVKILVRIGESDGR